VSNYPLGVTGNEFEIAGPDWEDDMLVRCCDCGWAGMATDGWTRTATSSRNFHSKNMRQAVSELADPKRIESIVGVKRASVHVARIVTTEERLYILHTHACVAKRPDLRECPFSLALDKGIDPEVWIGHYDVPICITIGPDGRLIPASGWVEEHRESSS
jgi:hypothetical protein